MNKRYSTVLIILSVLLFSASCSRIVLPGSASNDASVKTHNEQTNDAQSQGDQAIPEKRTQADAANAFVKNEFNPTVTGQSAVSEPVKNNPVILRESGFNKADSREARLDEQQSGRTGKVRNGKRIKFDKQAFGESYAEANLNAIGLTLSGNGEKAKSGMDGLRSFHPEMFLPAAALPAIARMRDHFDFSDPLYLALFIILVVLLVILAVFIIVGTIDALGWIGVLLLAGLIVALVLLL